MSKGKAPRRGESRPHRTARPSAKGGRDARPGRGEAVSRPGARGSGAKRSRPGAARDAGDRPASDQGARARIAVLEERLRQMEVELAAARLALARRPAAQPGPAARPPGPAAEPEPEFASLEEAQEAEEIEELEEVEEAFEDYEEEKDFLSPGGDLTQRRADLDRERADRELELSDEPFWMVCPKCGESLSEHEFDAIKVDRCESCGGIWMDRGESDLLLAGASDDHALAYRTRGLLQ